MDIYFLRHGETMWNRERRIQGSTAETTLTDFGVALAEQTRDGFARKGLRFDRAYTSPFRRALQTAEIVLEGQPCRAAPDERIREMGFGPYEGTAACEGAFADENIRACFQNPPAYVPKGEGESFAAVEARLADFLRRELAPLEGSCRSVLAVCHGGVMRSLRRLLLQTPLHDFWSGRQPNCCIHVVRLEDGAFRLAEQGKVLYDLEAAKAYARD